MPLLHGLSISPVLSRLRSKVGWATLCYWLSWPALICSFFYLAARYITDTSIHGHIYNSDAMFFPVFYRDVLMRGTMAGWDLPTNPYFFPDMLLFVPIDILNILITNNVYLSAILYGVAQLLLLVTGILLLQRRLFGTDPLPQALTLLTATVCILHMATRHYISHLFAFMSVHHFGAVVVIPFATLALLGALQVERTHAQRRLSALLLFVLTFVTSFSDSLFVIQFVLPALAGLLLWRKGERGSWRPVLLLGAGLLLAAGAGQWLRQFLVPVDKLMRYTSGWNWPAISKTFADFVKECTFVFNAFPLLALFWVASTGALVACFVVATRRLRQNEKEARPLYLVSGLFLASILVSTLIAVLSGNDFSPRYYLPFIYLPCFAGWPLFLAQWLSLRKTGSWAGIDGRRRVVAGTATLLALLTTGYTLFSGQAAAFTSGVEYEDPFVVCLEEEAAKRNLHYGLADYWQTNYTVALTEGKVQIAAILADLSPYVWNNNRYSYQAPFEFVIIDHDKFPEQKVQAEIVVQRFGEAAETFACGDSTIYVYNRPSDLQFRHWFANYPLLAELAEVGDQAQFDGFALTAETGVATGLSRGASEAWGNREGVLTSLPLYYLPAGRYGVALHLFADSANTGSWEVLTRSEQGTHPIARGAIEAAGKSVVSGHFELTQEANVEIHVNFAGRGTLFVDQISVNHIEQGEDEFVGSPVPVAPSTTAGAALEGAYHLIHPSPGSSIDQRNVDFVWEWTGRPLPKEQTFEVRLWRKGEPFHYGAHDVHVNAQLLRQIDNTYMMRLDLNGAYSVQQHGAGDYEWTVGIVAVEPAYQDLQIEAVPSQLSLLP